MTSMIRFGAPAMVLALGMVSSSFAGGSCGGVKAEAKSCAMKGETAKAEGKSCGMDKAGCPVAGEYLQALRSLSVEQEARAASDKEWNQFTKMGYEKSDKIVGLGRTFPKNAKSRMTYKGTNLENQVTKAALKDLLAGKVWSRTGSYEGIDLYTRTDAPSLHGLAIAMTSGDKADGHLWMVVRGASTVVASAK